MPAERDRTAKTSVGWAIGVRRRAAGAALLLLVWLAFAPVLAAAEAPVQAVTAVGFTVSDADQTAAFFRDVLGFEALSDVEASGEAHERLAGVFGARMRTVRMRLGTEEIELTQFLAPEGRPIPADVRPNDHTFQHVAIITSDMEEAYARLREHGIRHASSGPQELPDWNPNAGGIKAFYFRDPDGHFLELLEFPEGKGEARWHREDALFLGIDHTAIVVDETERSLAFYQDRLGLTVAGSSENWGPEQERLNGVFAARLRITALRAAEGPGIELLEYVSPSDGRPAPPDLRSNDVLHWQTTLATRELDRLTRRLLQASVPFLSPGAVEVGDSELGFRAAALFRDPDGHPLRLIER